MRTIDVNTPPSLDPEVFDELYESVCEQEVAVATLYETFLENAARLIEALRAADPDTAREKALHTLKGSAAMMGATRIARLATELQRTSATLEDTRMRDAIDELVRELATLRQAVDARLAALGIGLARD